MEPILRTISGHEIVWISAWNPVQLRRFAKESSIYIGNLQQVREEVVHVDKPKDAQDKRGNLPRIKCDKEDEEQEGESRETSRSYKHQFHIYKHWQN
jgi:hypothetical protein